MEVIMSENLAMTTSNRLSIISAACFNSIDH